jgi:hypothetical protein
MREFLRKRPWMWIVLLLGTLVLANLVFVAISLFHPVAPASGR